METPEPDRLAFDYIKSNFFRVVHVDGVIGSGTATGLVHIACYSERPSIPRRMVFDVSADGVLGEEVTSLRENRDSVVRELETDLLMSVQVARSLRDWLNVQLSNIQEMRKMDVPGRKND